jgi:hypothetical protein
MSKKRKRQIRVDNARKSVASQSPASPSLSGTTRSWRDDFNPDYTYVIKDLRRIGTLAGTFLLILIVLSFFLR